MWGNVIWTSHEDEILINFVRTQEPLFNVNHKDYRKAPMKNILWSNIGTTLKKSGSDCSKRWAYVRDYYIRRRGKPGIGSGGEAAKKRADLLSFLDNIRSSQRNTITNVVEDELPEDESEIITHITKFEETEDMSRINCNEDNNKGDVRKADAMRDKKKIKLAHSEERLQLPKQIAHDELDETDLFFHSMAKIVKKLPRYEQAQLRMEVSSLVGNAELRSMSNESHQSSESSSRRASFSLL